MSIYDCPCPHCGGKITMSERFLDDNVAKAFCDAKHEFTRTTAMNPKTNRYLARQQAAAFHTHLSATLAEVRASQQTANKRAIAIIKREIEKSGPSPSTGRFFLTMTHKYGHTLEEARLALKYVQDRRTELGIPATAYTDEQTRRAYKAFKDNLKIKSSLEEADMKSEFGQMPPFTASPIKAAARLRALATAEVEAATKLMARATQVSRVAEKGMRDIVQQMIKLGYTADTTQHKALYTTVFTKEPESEEEKPHTFQMVGWHGTGRYGAEKTILEFYDDEKDPRKPVVTIGVVNDENINPVKQMEVVQHIMEYVKHHG